MMSIAGFQGVDLLKVKAGNEFVSQVKETQNRYQALHQEYQCNPSWYKIHKNQQKFLNFVEN